MTQLTKWECDVCGLIDTTEYGELVKMCVVCNDDFCKDCQKEHALDECFP